MTGTHCLCAASTMDLATTPLCGATIRTSTPCVSMLSACFVCTASSPLATSTDKSAPTSLACCSTSSLSRCQRSSLSVSIEKPIFTGPVFFDLSGQFTLVVCCGPLVTQPAHCTIKAARRIIKALVYRMDLSLPLFVIVSTSSTMKGALRTESTCALAANGELRASAKNPHAQNGPAGKDSQTLVRAFRSCPVFRGQRKNKLSLFEALSLTEQCRKFPLKF